MESLDAFGPAADMFRRFRDPVEGKKALIDENLFIEVLLANAAITRKMTEKEMDVYRAPFLKSESRYPIYMWPNELPVGGRPARNVQVVERVGEWLRISETPKLLQYASPGILMPRKQPSGPCGTSVISRRNSSVTATTSFRKTIRKRSGEASWTGFAGLRPMRRTKQRTVL